MTFTITNAAVFDGRDMLDGRLDVSIDGGIIAAMTPAGSADPVGDAIDATGATLLPGLIDGHVHIARPEDIAGLLSAGVTSAADMATWPPEHLAALRAQSRGLEFRSPGAPLIGPAGPHSHMPGLASAVIDSPDAARREVADRVAQGVDYIKLVLEAEGRGGPHPDAALAAVQAAHAAGLRVVAHASAVGAIELGVAIGVDILTHAPLDGAVSEHSIARIISNRIVVIPTLIMMHTVAERRGIPEAYGNAKRFVATLHEAGVTIVAGSDANSAPKAPANVPHASGVRDEMKLLVEAGLSPTEALRAATSTAAEVFAWIDRGRIRTGARADLLLADGDPVSHITDIDGIRAVWIAGTR